MQACSVKAVERRLAYRRQTMTIGATYGSDNGSED